ncbi:MAG TPA: winged helix-turn-helix domain-containing protein [Nitrososphaeraceae archaeon]|jgi:predicted transcriptional regulator
MTKRSRDEIYASILRSSAQDTSGMGITRIMYNTFLSYSQLSESLEELTRFRLLAFSHEDKKFKITERGRRFMQIVEEMDDILKVRGSPN